jgi:hypothetical protein
LVNNMPADSKAVNTGVLAQHLPEYYFATAGLLFFGDFFSAIGTIL